MVTWKGIREDLMGYEFGTTYEISKKEIGPIPPWLHITDLGEPQGEIRQYRDSKKRNSLHVKEFKNCYTAHIDKYNPEHDAISHLIHDAPAWGAAFLVAGIALFKIFRR